jgi:hypothetical protein
MTLDEYVAAVGARAPAALGALVFRSLPFACYGIVCRRTTRRVRVALLAGVATLLGCAWGWRPTLVTDLLPVPGVFAYFVLCAIAIHALRHVIRPSAVRAGALLFVACLLFVAVPAVSLHEPGMAALLVVGWEVALSAHSYGVDTLGRASSWRGALTFLLVHPTLVYAERPGPVAPPGGDWRAGLRILAGTMTLVGREAALVAVAGVPWTRPADLGDVVGPRSYLNFATSQLPLLIGLYCAHSGLASIQIGWMRLLGYRVPERYRLPLLAVSPRDFWERWNTWIGRWLHLYVYRPVGRRAMRRVPPAAAGAVAALAAFTACGALHDFGAWGMRASAGHAEMTPKFSELFFLIGVIYVVWQLGARWLSPHPVGRLTRVLKGVAGWAATLQLVCVLAWLAIPLLRTGAWPLSVERAMAALAVSRAGR